ncbi:hypothetical protein AB0E69_01525 [Kribbella sp. NPDC026611]|uniref:hypothetical protein n=1 Tax=Kribbella sp. NPDC026611 TaxID=3154911 RepID=UPI00340046B8
MTAQHQEPQPEARPAQGPDPIGPITLPTRTRTGARALALVGTVGLSAFAIAAVTDGCSTWTTISVN